MLVYQRIRKKESDSNRGFIRGVTVANEGLGWEFRTSKCKSSSWWWRGIASCLPPQKHNLQKCSLQLHHEADLGKASMIGNFNHFTLGRSACWFSFWVGSSQWWLRKHLRHFSIFGVANFFFSHRGSMGGFGLPQREPRPKIGTRKNWSTEKTTSRITFQKHVQRFFFGFFFFGISKWFDVYFVVVFFSLSVNYIFFYDGCFFFWGWQRGIAISQPR